MKVVLTAYTLKNAQCNIWKWLESKTSSLYHHVCRTGCLDINYYAKENITSVLQVITPDPPYQYACCSTIAWNV